MSRTRKVAKKKTKWTEVQLRLIQKQKAFTEEGAENPQNHPSKQEQPEPRMIGTFQARPRVVSELLPPNFTVGMSLHSPKVTNRD